VPEHAEPAAEAGGVQRQRGIGGEGIVVAIVFGFHIQRAFAFGQALVDGQGVQPQAGGC